RRAVPGGAGQTGRRADHRRESASRPRRRIVTPRSRTPAAKESGAYLLDVNRLVALAWPTHVHHGAARRWFARCHGEGWATTSVTEFGFVRVSANPAAVGDPLTPAEAIGVLEEIRRRPGHETWPDDTSPTDG